MGSGYQDHTATSYLIRSARPSLPKQSMFHTQSFSNGKAVPRTGRRQHCLRVSPWSPLSTNSGIHKINSERRSPPPRGESGAPFWKRRKRIRPLPPSSLAVSKRPAQKPRPLTTSIARKARRSEQRRSWRLEVLTYMSWLKVARLPV